MKRPSSILLAALLLAPLAVLNADEIIVRDADALRAALRDLKPATVLKISPGVYPGGHTVSGIAKLTIQALDPKQPPVFKGGKTAFQFSRCPELTLRHLRITGQSDNGLNLDDGSPCAAAFVGVDSAEFVGNTIRFPEKWIFRILQETKEPGFAPCRNVLIKDNRITFRRTQVGTEINIGGGTAPETFRFENNRWLAEDKPQASQPKLPVKEKGGIYGQPDAETKPAGAPK
jgi:hypothetical protein